MAKTTRRVGAFGTTALTAVLMYERPTPCDGWEKHSKGQRATRRIASSVDACLLPRKRFRTIGFNVREGRFVRPNRVAETRSAIASINNVKAR